MQEKKLFVWVEWEWEWEWEWELWIYDEWRVEPLKLKLKQLPLCTLLS